MPKSPNSLVLDTRGLEISVPLLMGVFQKIAKPKYRLCHVMSLDGDDTFFPPGQAKRK